MALLTAFLIAGVLGFIKEGPIYELLGDDITAFNEQFYDKLRVVNFYMFSFTTRQEFNTVYFKAAKQCQNESIPIIFGKIDRINAKNEQVVKDFHVQGVPHTIYYLANSSIPRIYLGPRTKDGLIAYLSKKLYKLHTFSNVDDLKDTIMSNFYLEGLILGVFSPNDVEIHDKFIQFSYDNSHIYNFGVMNYSEDLAEELEINSSAIVACRGPGLISFQDDYYKSISNFTDLDLSDWARQKAHPHIAYQTKDREPTLFTHAPLITLIMDLTNTKVRNEFIHLISYWSKHLLIDDRDRQKYTWAIADKAEYSQEVEDYGMSDLLMFYLIKHHGNIYIVDEEVYESDGIFVHHGLRKFYYDFAMDAAKTFIKSERLKVEVENGVVVANGKSFDDKVIHSGRDQVVYVHSGAENYGRVIQEVAQEFDVVKINKAKNYFANEYNNNEPEYILISKVGNKRAPETYRGSMRARDIIDFARGAKKDL